MDIQFFRVNADSLDTKVEYIKHKLTYSPTSLPQTKHWASAIDSLNEMPAVEQPANWPTLSANLRAKVQQRIKCATKMANRSLTASLLKKTPSHT